MDNRLKENAHLYHILDAMLDMKAENIEVYYTGSDSPISDWVVICEGTNFTQVKAIAENIRSHFKEQNDLLPNTEEGKEQRRWVLLDYFDIVVHVMLPELRAYYKLEELWKDAEKFEITDENFEKL